MQRKPRFLVVACTLCALLFYAWVRRELAYRRALKTICWGFANQLLTDTNAQNLVRGWTGPNFSAFLALPAKVETVQLGDKPSDFLRDTFGRQAHATARLCFTNQSNKHFEIRIRQTGYLTNFTVIGAGW